MRNLYPHIRVETPVTRARRRDDGIWEVTSGHGETLQYDVLVVANGHHWDPKWPEPYPGHFALRADSFAQLPQSERPDRYTQQAGDGRGIGQ